MSSEILTGVLAAAGCGAVSWWVPALIRRVPEPAPDPVDEDPEKSPPPPKVAYATIAASPHLAWRSALAGAVAGGALGFALGAVWELLLVLPLVPIGVALAVIDWRTQLLPLRVVAPAYVVAIVACLVCAAITGEPERLRNAAIGWAVIGGLYLLLWFVYPPGMGYGDVRLAGVLGIVLGYFGYDAATYGLLLGIFLGAIGGLAFSLLRLVDRKNSPFGPYLLIGAWLGIVLASLAGG